MITGKKIPFVKENILTIKALKILSEKKLGILIVLDKKKNTWNYNRWSNKTVYSKNNFNFCQ